MPHFSVHFSISVRQNWAWYLVLEGKSRDSRKFPWTEIGSATEICAFIFTRTIVFCCRVFPLWTHFVYNIFTGLYFNYLTLAMSSSPRDPGAIVHHTLSLHCYFPLHQSLCPQSFLVIILHLLSLQTKYDKASNPARLLREHSYTGVFWDLSHSHSITYTDTSCLFCAIPVSKPKMPWEVLQNPTNITWLL